MEWDQHNCLCSTSTLSTTCFGISRLAVVSSYPVPYTPASCVFARTSFVHISVDDNFRLTFSTVFLLPLLALCLDYFIFLNILNNFVSATLNNVILSHDCYYYYCITCLAVTRLSAKCWMNWDYNSQISCLVC